MNTAFLVAIVIATLGGTGTLLWFIGKMDAAEDKGEQKIRDEIKTGALHAKEREASDYAAPRDPDWRDLIKRL